MVRTTIRGLSYSTTAAQENQKPCSEKTTVHNGTAKNKWLFSTIKIKLRHFAPIFLQAHFPHEVETDEAIEEPTEIMHINQDSETDTYPDKAIWQLWQQGYYGYYKATMASIKKGGRKCGKFYGCCYGQVDVRKRRLTHPPTSFGKASIAILHQVRHIGLTASRFNGTKLGPIAPLIIGKDALPQHLFQ
ncbi:hypothetical protein TNCV_1414401 [Trichonephila clavipes]|nr:hypothetical protein TNCV_1414401 [Trichonephila clavipes]